MLAASGVAAAILVLAFLLPSFLRRQARENDAQAIRNLRQISIGTENYWERHGHYPTRLDAMAQPNERISDDVREILRRGKKSGYRYTYSIHTIDANGFPHGFTLQASPAWRKITGRRHFYLDENELIRVEEARPATVHSPLLR